jgi:hypothetical protein
VTRKKTNIISFYLFVALLLAIVVSHGCHGDDFDHEPCFIPKLDQEP